MSTTTLKSHFTRVDLPYFLLLQPNQIPLYIDTKERLVEGHMEEKYANLTHVTLLDDLGRWLKVT